VNRIFSSRRRFVAVAITAVIIAGAAGTAAAYFSASGTGSSTAYVGASATFTVTVGTETPPGTYLLPDYPVGNGPNIEHFAYSVTNNSAGNVYLNHVNISLTGLPTNCQANWFSIDSTSPSGTNTQNPATTLGGGATYNGSTTVELIDSGTPQDACVGATPTVNVQATSS
jgi:hypothetical protein